MLPIKPRDEDFAGGLCASAGTRKVVTFTFEAFRDLRHGVIQGSDIILIRRAEYTELQGWACSVCGASWRGQHHKSGKFELEDDRYGYIGGGCCGGYLPASLRAAMLDTGWTHHPKGRQQNGKS